MEDGRIIVDTDSLTQTRKDLQESLKRIRMYVENISGHMAALNSMWTGDAHEAFLAQADSDIGFLREACDGIQSVIDFEDTALSRYDSCERQVAEVVSQIRF